MHTLRSLTPRLLAGFGTLTLLASIGLFASRPVHGVGGPVPVTVANTPLATTAADNPDQQPFQHTGVITADGVAFTFATVPAKKRLVIESVTAFSNTPNNSHNYVVAVSRAGSLDGFQIVDLLANGSLFSAVTQKVLFYAEAGDVAKVSVQSGGSSTAPAILVTLSGHYTDVP